MGSLGKKRALRMASLAWMCKQVIALGALSLAIVPLCRPAESAPAATQEPAPQLQSSTNSTDVESAAKPLQVIYKDGQLTIVAENYSLSDIMKALRGLLMMDIDLPPGGTQQRVWVHLGPGPARRVLRDLLDSTEFNYVIQASEGTPDGIRSILLTPRSKSVGPEEAAGKAEVAANHRNPRGGSTDEGSESENSASAQSESTGSGAPLPVAAPASSENQQLPSTNASHQSNGAPANVSSNASAGGSVGDQMIQQLQSMYQQRRQIQVQQNQKNAATAPNQ